MSDNLLDVWEIRLFKKSLCVSELTVLLPRLYVLLSREYRVAHVTRNPNFPDADEKEKWKN